jgi:hypothetical protein
MPTFIFTARILSPQHILNMGDFLWNVYRAFFIRLRILTSNKCMFIIYTSTPTCFGPSGPSSGNYTQWNMIIFYSV